MPNRSAQVESFSLANMVPQVHANNAGVWAGIEGAARQLAMNEGSVYVLSGPAFIGRDIQRIGTRDQVGLTMAKELQSLVGRIVKALEAEKQLPESVELKAAVTVKNSFL